MSGRRDFLRGLASLPLIGGSVALIGQPSAVAESVTPDLLEAYKTWLDSERRFLSWDMAADPAFDTRYRISEEFRVSADERVNRFRTIDRCFSYVGQSGSYHGGRKATSPYSRAALVLSTVGCDWREDGI